MALNRAWYNALVDDDGSGMTGSVWDKTDIKNLLDSVDAEIARLDTLILGAATFWTPTLVGSGGGTPVYTYQQAWYQKTGSLVYVAGRLTLSGKGSLLGTVALGNFPVTLNATIPQAGPAIGYFFGINNLASIATYGTGARQFNLSFIPPAGGNSQLIDASYITGAFDIIFGGTYLG